MYIYKTTNLVNNKIYIGQCTKSLEKTENYLGSGTAIKQAIMKFGKENFKKEILIKDVSTQEELDSLEEFFITTFKSNEREIGYNILKGSSNNFGSGSPMKIESVRKKVSKSLRIRFIINPLLRNECNKRRLKWWSENDSRRKQYSDFGKTLIGEKNPNFGKKWTDEMKKSLSEKIKAKNYNGENNPNFGKKWDDEKKKLLSIKQKENMLKNGNPMSGKIRITNGEINTVINKDDTIPQGFRLGMTRKTKKS